MIIFIVPLIIFLQQWCSIVYNYLNIFTQHINKNNRAILSFTLQHLIFNR